MNQLENMTEPELRDFCNACAGALLEVAKDQGVEKPLFVLVLFNDPKIAQYISNCSRDTTIEAMRETAERLAKKQDVMR